MVKVTSSILLGAALVASSAPALAAPTRFTARGGSDLASPSGNDVDGVKEKREDVKDHSAPVSRRNSISAEKRDCRTTSTDSIRRGLPLIPGAALTERDVVSDLGLAGTLAPLGLGDLLPTLTGAISGLPVVGEPVGGLVKTVDDTVGVTSLLKPKPATPAAAAPAAKRDLLSTLTGTLGGTVGSLPIVGGTASGVLDSATGTVSSTLGSTPLGGILGQLQGNPQLASLLGQLQALGLGNLPLSQLSQLQSAVSSQGGSVLSSAPAGSAMPSAANGLMGQLSIAQAEQLGLLAPGTSRSLLATLEATQANNKAASSPGAQGYAFNVTPHGFKAAANETEPASSASAPAAAAATPSSTSSADPGAPTFAIASPEAVASAMAAREDAPAPSGASSGGANSFAAHPAAKGEGEDDDSASEYSDDDDESVDGSLFDASEDESDDGMSHEVGMEGQGPNASGHGTDWNTPSATASGEQATATAEAMSLSYSDASATAVPTSTGNAKRWAVQLD
ncbi:hypothetical protein JCM6882_007755 [Rhodosporidiobolus microsporus]